MSLSCRGSAPAGAFDVFPDHLPTSRALFLEPPAAPCEILDQVSIPPGERIAVLGDGKLGLLIAMVLNAHGYRVHQFGRHAAKLAITARAGVVTQRATEMATEIANGALPPAAYDWVVDAHRQPRRTALRRRHDPSPRYRDSEIDRAWHGGRAGEGRLQSGRSGSRPG